MLSYLNFLLMKILFIECSHHADTTYISKNDIKAMLNSLDKPNPAENQSHMEVEVDDSLFADVDLPRTEYIDNEERFITDIPRYSGAESDLHENRTYFTNDDVDSGDIIVITNMHNNINNPIVIYYLNNSLDFQALSANHQINNQIDDSVNPLSSYNDPNTVYFITEIHSETDNYDEETSFDARNININNLESLENNYESNIVNTIDPFLTSENQSFVIDNVFCNMIVEKYGFNMVDLINFSCELNLKNHEIFNCKISQKYIYFINLKGVPILSTETINIRKNYDIFFHTVKRFVPFANEVLKELECLSYSHYFENLKILNINDHNEYKNTKLKFYNNLLSKEKKYKFLLPELEILLAQANRLINNDCKARNQFLLILSMIFSIFEINKDVFLDQNEILAEINSVKIFNHYVEMLKVRTFLLIYYKKYVSGSPMLSKGIVICLVNFMILDNSLLSTVSILNSHHQFYYVVDKIIKNDYNIPKEDLAIYSTILFNRSYKKCINFFLKRLLNWKENKYSLFSMHNKQFYVLKH